MKTILIIHLIISIITFVFCYMTVKYVATKFKKENPNFTIRKKTKLEKAIAWFRCILISFCPILNIFILLIWVLAWDTCVEQLEDKIFLYEN